LNTLIDFLRRLIRNFDFWISRFASSMAESQLNFVDLSDKVAIDIDKVIVYHFNMLVRKDDLFPTQYRATLSGAERERQQISERLELIEAEAAVLRQRLQWLDATIDALRPLCQTEQETQDAPRIAEVCYHVLRNLGRPATAPEIRDVVQTMFDLKQYPNALAVIHTVLSRMNTVKRYKQTDGKTYYQVVAETPGNPGGLG
jgi:hypothetical protein